MGGLGADGAVQERLHRRRHGQSINPPANSAAPRRRSSSSSRSDSAASRRDDEGGGGEEGRSETGAGERAVRWSGMRGGGIITGESDPG
jgi:hypothetical protein